jgi:conjugative transfer region protein TrbK
MSIFGRAVAYVVLAVALLAAAITFNVGKYPAGEASNPESSAATSDLGGELARCKTIGPGAADAGCKAAWEANRNRFFQSGKSYQDRLTDTVPAKTDSKEAVAQTGADPNSVQRSPTTQNSPDRHGDATGRLK